MGAPRPCPQEPEYRMRRLCLTMLAATLPSMPLSSPLFAQGGVPPFGTAQQFGVPGAAMVTKTNATSVFHRFAGYSPFTDLSGSDLGGRTLLPGVYRFTSSSQLTGKLQLDFLGDPNAVFVFQIFGTLTAASGSTVSALNGVPGGGVFWQVGSSAMLGSGTRFLGNLVAQESITMASGARIRCGTAIALTGAVTMDHNAFSDDCGTVGDPSAPPLTAVPEPASMVLLATGLIGLSAVQFRRRKKLA